MVSICTNCWTTCDTQEPDEDMVNFMASGALAEEMSICCLSDIITIDEEDLEEVALEIESSCFTFDEALERYGNIAYYIAENLVYVPEYEER